MQKRQTIGLRGPLPGKWERGITELLPAENITCLEKIDEEVTVSCQVNINVSCQRCQ